MSRLPEKPLEALEPVVSYSLLPPDTAPPQGRVEPRFTVLAMDRKSRFDEIAAPSPSEVAEHGERLDAVDADILPPEPRDPRRRRMPRVAVVVGAVALILGAGVLAFAFGKIFTGGNSVTQAPAVESPEVALAPPPPPTADMAGPGVRVIPADESAAAIPAASGEDVPLSELELAPDAPVAEPDAAAPLPRLRPTTDDQGDVASLPQPLPLPVQPPLPSAGAPAAAPDDEVGALMANVDRLLASRKGGAHQAAVAEPLTSGIGLFGGAEIALQNAATLSPQADGPVLIPDDGMPVPPADIPNPVQ